MEGGLNTYSYALNNPLYWIDPTGLDVGAPGFGESFIPIWGSGRESINDFQNGSYVWGTVNGALAVSEVLLLSTAGKAICKGAWKLGSHTWRRTRSGTAPHAICRPIHKFTNWLIEQNSKRSVRCAHEKAI